MRLGLFVILVAVASCAQLEGLDHFANVGSLSDAVTQPDASPGSSSGSLAPPVTTGDVPPPSPSSEAGAPADGGGTSDDAAVDSGSVEPPPPPPPPPPTDIAPNGVATSSDGIMQLATNQPALNDANDGTDFTLGADTCLATGECGQLGGGLAVASPSIQVAFAAAQTIAHVTILGSRNAALAGAHVLTGQLQLLDARGAPLATRELSMGDPYGDADVVLETPVANVITVRLIIESAASPQPSFAEIKIYSE